LLVGGGAGLPGLTSGLARCPGGLAGRIFSFTRRLAMGVGHGCAGLAGGVSGSLLRLPLGFPHGLARFFGGLLRFPLRLTNRRPSLLGSLPNCPPGFVSRPAGLLTRFRGGAAGLIAVGVRQLPGTAAGRQYGQ
jgi:hypothetical protein